MHQPFRWASSSIGKAIITKTKYLIVMMILTLCGCFQRAPFEISDFNPMSNYDFADTLHYQVDMTNAVRNGIIVPTKQGEAFYFLPSFNIRNRSLTTKRYYYKVFYQNESYGYDIMDQPGKANQNFYGSWQSNNTGFHMTEPIPPGRSFVTVTDTFAIVGNPRNEAKFFGSPAENTYITPQELDSTIQVIRQSIQWTEEIVKKAAQNDISIESQTELDARWWLQYNREKGDENNRWKRNPRAGVYNFLLVVVTEDELDNIPDYYRDVTVPDSAGEYRNPFAYYLYANENYRGREVLQATQKLKVTVKYDISSGIFVDMAANNHLHSDYLSELCNCDDSLFYRAQFEQFFHSSDKKHTLEQIPKAFDYAGTALTREQYESFVLLHEKNGRVRDYIRNTAHPCKTVGYDLNEQAMYMINPGTTDRLARRKENVGLKTRHGLTYGKYRAKIMFPEILGDDFVWNGITCAFWLIYQQGEWNTRGTSQTGYLPKLLFDSVRRPSSIYSEIDIEIVKTSKYWPRTSYGKDQKHPVDDAINNQLIIACTNWDLACKDPENFHVGVRELIYKNKRFALHRWDDNYQAVTSKYEYPHDSIMGRAYWYEIEWHPNYIVWRVGPSKDKMRVIGYMDAASTKIPDNQMQMVFTQEYHLAEWWPLTPFKQGFIPYPATNLTGFIYEVEIE